MQNLNLEEHVRVAIKNSHEKKSKLCGEILNFQGLSSYKVKHLLNNLCNFNECRYLEIGTYTGSTFTSAVFNNELDATCIDFWHTSRPTITAKNLFFQNLSRLSINQDSNIKSKYTIIDEDSFKLDIKKYDIKNINVYFYDGDHTEDCQFNAFMYYNEVFCDEFIAVIDDWRSDEVRRGTEKAFQSLKYNVLGTWILPGEGEPKINSEFWWAGLGVFLIKK